MAAKKRTRGRPKSGAGPNKSDFVRQHPNLPAADVVAKAKESGIHLSSNLVYMVRATDRKRGSGTAKRRPKQKVRARIAGTRRNGAAIVEFKKMAFALGIENARRALDELERGLATLFGE